MSKTENPLRIPGHPWELEVLAIIFILIALLAPTLYEGKRPGPDTSGLSIVEKAALEREAERKAETSDPTMLIWGAVIIGAYAGHVILSRSSISFLSTPFTSLLMPLLFSMVAFFRLRSLNHEAPDVLPFMSGSLSQGLLLFLIVATVTVILARIRMKRYMLSIKDIEWKIKTHSKYDFTFFELIMYFFPLIYPPRRFLACEHGMLIRGFLYVMPIPFDLIHAISPVKQMSFITSADVYATSIQSLVRIDLTEQADPIVISPAGREEFVEYCVEHLDHHSVAHG